MQLKRLMLSDIKGSVYQPRSQDDLELQGLVESILRNGLICPIIVRQFDKFEEKLIANDTIESWVTNKKLRMVKSRKGERIIFNVESVDEFLDIVDVIRSTGFKIWR